MKASGRVARAAVFWGALWGILEASIGALVHLLPGSVGSLVWMPIAMSCLAGAYRRAGDWRAPIFAACVASAIKLTNLYMPVRIDTVINPAAAILLEGAAFALIAALRRGMPKRVAGAVCFSLSVNTLWRVVYAVYLLALPAWMRDISALSSQAEAIKFFVTENAATALLACFAVRAPAITRAEPDERPRKSHAPLMAFMCALGIILPKIL